MALRIPGRNNIPTGASARVPFKIRASGYYLSESGSWLRKAEGTVFTSPLRTVEWLVRNRPRKDSNPVDFLMRALGSGNRSVHDQMKVFMMYAHAYEYIRQKAGARAELNNAFFAVLDMEDRSEKLKELDSNPDIKPHMISDRIDLRRFTQLRDDIAWISSGSLKIVIKVYLHFALDFCDTNEVEDQGPRKGYTGLHIA